MRYTNSLFVGLLILLCVSASTTFSQRTSECSAERFVEAEKAFRERKIRNTQSRVERTIVELLENCSNAETAPGLTKKLVIVREERAEKNFLIAKYYFDKHKQSGSGLKGAQVRLRLIVDEFPDYSRMDKVLFFLAETYLIQDAQVEAEIYLRKLVEAYPNSEVSAEAQQKLKAIHELRRDPKRQ